MHIEDHDRFFTPTHLKILDALTSSYGLQQIVNEPTHILLNFSSCIDLIFTDQPSLNDNSGTHPSLQANCHHQITYHKLNLKIEYPRPYQRLVWNFKKAIITSIRKAIHTIGIFCFSMRVVMNKFLFSTTH